MIVPPFARWSAYALAAALTVVAAVSVGDGGTDAVVQPSARAAAVKPAAGAASAGGAGSLGLVLPTARSVQRAVADPFAVHGAPADERPALETAARAPVAVPVAPSAPPLPFVYLGRWKEQGRTSIFVQRDDRSYKIDGPGPLDAEYAVREVGEDRITLNYLPLGVVQVLRLDAPAAERPVAAAPPAPNTPEPDPGEN